MISNLANSKRILKIITFTWVGVYGLNTLLFLSISQFTALIFSVIIMVLATFISFAFPFIAPILFNLIDFRKDDWRVDMNLNRLKNPDEYDVIIVGAGLGGLTCAALLAKRGYKVAVFEHQHHVGGYCSSFKRKGFTFNTGVEDVSGLSEDAAITFLLKELGLKKEDLFIRNTTRYFYNSRIIDIPLTIDELIKVLTDIFPDEQQNLPSFFSDAKLAYEECYRDVAVYGTIFPPELVAKLFGIKKLLLYPTKYKHFYDWLQKTYTEKLDEYFENEELKRVLCALMSYLGSEPHKTLAINVLAACVTFLLNGGYSIKGGAQSFSEVLKDFIVSNNGKVVLNNKVEKILVDGGRVNGIQAQDGRYFSPVVVSNIDAKSTFNRLVGPEHLKKSFLQYINSLKMSTSFFLLYLAVDMDLLEYPILLKNINEGWEITINSNSDKGMAPFGKSSITVLLDKNINYADFPDRASEEYAKRKDEIAEMLIDKIEKHIPGLRENIVFKEAATPKTFERYNLMPEGAVYSFDLSMDIKRPFFKTPVKGLYLAGASVFPGAGVEAVVMSGTLCANDICDWKI